LYWYSWKGSKILFKTPSDQRISLVEECLTKTTGSMPDIYLVGHLEITRTVRGCGTDPTGALGALKRYPISYVCVRTLTL
jgi:hypothetical protein